MNISSYIFPFILLVIFLVIVEVIIRLLFLRKKNKILKEGNEKEKKELVELKKEGIKQLEKLEEKRKREPEPEPKPEPARREGGKVEFDTKRRRETPKIRVREEKEERLGRSEEKREREPEERSYDRERETVSERDLQETSERALSDYKEKLKDLEKKMERVEKNFLEEVSRENEKIKKEMAGAVEDEISRWKEENSNIRNFLEKEVKEKSEEILGKMDQVYKPLEETVRRKAERAEREIENYKTKKMEEIDKNIYRIIKDVSRRVIGRAVDLSTHEDLVLEALEKAREENFFTLGNGRESFSERPKKERAEKERVVGFTGNGLEDDKRESDENGFERGNRIRIQNVSEQKNKDDRDIEERFRRLTQN